ncbi:putative toxin-antitoxin system toxin component, PIN family [Haladaptatus sp. F3-133]|uniref:Toxin-antitoxin system toxin component, PIN family n=1 Tax=Halorutilus salinus TaxID=2487751 RepID=A0A9Q4C4T5_9EURY|nr:putative toxin-antitoxin system toxin component, PIN family [Halorutilus salinus]
MKIVLDTNVYVSATLSKGNPYHVLKSAEKGETDLYISPFILHEIEDVLGRDKIPFEEKDTERFVDKILTTATVVTPDDKPDVIEDDPSDNRILACGLEAGAEYVVSGDRHLLELEEHDGVGIMEPAGFIEEV